VLRIVLAVLIAAVFVIAACEMLLPL